jgi:hypothetical protein
MPSGGYRPGAGRKRGKPLTRGDAPVRVVKEQIWEEIARQFMGTMPASPTLTPKEYLLAVMNDPCVHPDRRDKCAIAVAPYCHGKATERTGKKNAQQDRAADAAAGRFSAGGAPDSVKMQ